MTTEVFSRLKNLIISGKIFGSHGEFIRKVTDEKHVVIPTGGRGLFQVLDGKKIRTLRVNDWRNRAHPELSKKTSFTFDKTPMRNGKTINTNSTQRHNGELGYFEFRHNAYPSRFARWWAQVKSNFTKPR